MTDKVDIFLKHQGVKGMKWGVRKDRGHEGEKAKTKTIAKLDKQYEKSFAGASGYIKVQNQMAEHINARVASLNDKHAGRDITDGSPGQKAYLRDYEKLVDDAAAASTEAFGTNASGTGRAKITRYGEGYESTWQAQWEDLKHADGDTCIKITPKFNVKGFIVSTKLEIIEKELKHFGVPGMKWGKHKAEVIPDGEVRVNQKKPGTKVASAGGKKIEAHPDAISAATSRQRAKASTTDALSNDELQKLVNRMNLEQQYSNILVKEAATSKGKNWVKQLRTVGKTANEVATFANSPAGKLLQDNLKDLKK